MRIVFAGTPAFAECVLVALVTADGAGAGAPEGSYAYLTAPVDPGVLAVTLRNAGAHAALGREAEDTRRQLEELNAISVRLSAERDTDTLLALILTKARQMTRSDAGSIYLVEELATGAPHLRFKLTQNDTVAVPFAEFTLPISHASAAGHAVLAHQVLRLDDAYALPPGSPFQINPDFDAQAGYRTKSMLVVPMRTPTGESIGVLELINCKHNMDRGFASRAAIEQEAIPFPERFRDLAASLASQAAVAIRSAQLVGELTKRHRRVAALVELSRQVSRLEPLDVLLHRIAEACGRLLGSDSVGFRLVEGNDLVVSATWGDAKEVMVTPRLKFGESLSGRVAATGEVLAITDLAADPRLLPAHRDAMIRQGHRALLAVPVKIGERVVGVLSVQLRREQPISSEDVALATAFASQAAIALENSRLYSELRTALEHLEGSQQQLVQVERLRALGEMAAGVAHDFNNLLAVILGRAELLLMQVSEPGHVQSLQAVRQAAMDGGQTVRRIQEFTRTRRTRPFGAVPLRALLTEVAEFTRVRWKDDAQSRGITYEVRVEGEVEPPVAGIAEELREVFLNLLINALDAMPAGGRVVFRLSADPQWATVAATDTGCGMANETRQRVLEPFFTTKGTRGTGLGLAVSWGIIQRHGGTIDIASALGEGSTFQLTVECGVEARPIWQCHHRFFDRRACRLRPRSGLSTERLVQGVRRGRRSARCRS